MLLRPWHEHDGEHVAAFVASSREHLRAWVPRVPEPGEIDGYVREQVERCEAGVRLGTALRLLGVSPESGEILGMFNLNNITRGAFESTDAGWQVGARHVGLGLATEGVRALLDIAFDPPPKGLGLHRVQANVIPSNGASLRVCGKCGFRVEGVAKAMLRINGCWQDHVMHAKLVDEHRAAISG